MKVIYHYFTVALISLLVIASGYFESYLSQAFVALHVEFVSSLMAIWILGAIRKSDSKLSPREIILTFIFIIPFFGLMAELYSGMARDLFHPKGIQDILWIIGVFAYGLSARVIYGLGMQNDEYANYKRGMFFDLFILIACLSAITQQKDPYVIPGCYLAMAFVRILLTYLKKSDFAEKE